MEIIENAVARGQRALSEFEAKRLLSAYGIPVTRESLVHSAEEAAQAAREIGFPVVVKGSSANLMHKTEAGAVVLNITDADAAAAAFDRLAGRLGDQMDGAIVSEMVSAKREIVLGLHREPQFGPCVMLGIGGVMAEVLNDTAFRVAPFDEKEALDMAAELRSAKIFEPFRGESAADMDALGRCLTGLGRIGEDHDQIAEIDINPMMIGPDGRLVAADALVVIKGGDHA
ncbi:MAG: acetate--CoA ligase family protein [Thermodesulfobacteriota bacterium]